jgi:hypothetical protein
VRAFVPLSVAPMPARRARAMHDLLPAGHATGTQPWARLWAEGHGQVWRQDADYIAQDAQNRLRALLA